MGDLVFFDDQEIEVFQVWMFVGGVYQFLQEILVFILFCNQIGYYFNFCIKGIEVVVGFRGVQVVVFDNI